MTTREDLTNQSNVLQVQIANTKDQFDSKLADLKNLQNAGEDTSAVSVDVENLRQQSADLEDNLKLSNQQLSNLDQSQDPTATIKSPDATNSDEQDVSTLEKYQNAGIVGATSTDEWGDLEGAIAKARIDTSGDGAKAFDLANMEPQGETTSRQDQLQAKGVGPGAEKITTPPSRVRTLTASGKEFGNDLRVRIQVPNEYLRSYAPGIAHLKENFNGIIFPYTPSINFDYSATYTAQQPMHSNFNFNFYQRSSVSNINIVGKFTVQNKRDAEIYLGTIQLLSALTKMKFGNDRDAGAPPPICRLHAYGTFMLKNVPISIASFRIDLPDSVDYFVYESADSQDVTSVPVSSQINIGCVLMYSRREVQEYSVDSFLNSYAAQKRKGFL